MPRDMVRPAQQEHYYKQLKGAAVKLSLEEFVAIWHELSSYAIRRPSLDVMRFYMHARRVGASHEEALGIATSNFKNSEFEAYFALRRRLSEHYVRQLIRRHRSQDTAMIINPALIMRALRKGFAPWLVTEYSARGKLKRLLALTQPPWLSAP